MGRKVTDKIIFENITVLDAGAKGVSVAKAPEGQVIFVTNVVPGDVIDVQTFKKRKSYFEGKAIKFHKYSENRIDAVCDHFGSCGGCKWQNMKYEQQLFYKNNPCDLDIVRFGHRYLLHQKVFSSLYMLPQTFRKNQYNSHCF